MVLLIRSVHLFHSSKNVPGKQKDRGGKKYFFSSLKTDFVVLVAQVTNLPQLADCL